MTPTLDHEYALHTTRVDTALGVYVRRAIDSATFPDLTQAL